MKAHDPAPIIEINARCYVVQEFYLGQIISNFKKQPDLTLTRQDNDMLLEAQQGSSCYAYGGEKPNVKEGCMRVAGLLICDAIERLNAFGDDPNEKKSVLVFLPGLAEIFAFIDALHEWYDPVWLRNSLELIPLHSSLNEDEQERAFKRVA
jgi:HrpA-like RNA helicase